MRILTQEQLDQLQKVQISADQLVEQVTSICDIPDNPLSKRDMQLFSQHISAAVSYLRSAMERDFGEEGETK